MQTRADYDSALAVIGRVIRQWDPYGLIGGGAPKDEWDGEIAELVSEIARIQSPKNAAEAISRVFSHAFQPEGFAPGDCAAVGNQLYSELVASGLIGA